MPEWFQTRVKYLKHMPNGLIQRVSEQYLVNAMSFTEAEARVLTEVQSGQREVTLAAISKSNVTEVVFYGDTERWHKCKVTYVVTDEDAEKEKKVTTYLMVNAEDVKEAYDRVQDHLKDMLVPFQVPKIEESPIVEIYGFQAGFRAGLRKATPSDNTETEGTIPERLETETAEFGTVGLIVETAEDESKTDDFKAKIEEGSEE